MKNIVCIGAGPACLTAAYLLSKEDNVNITVIEQDPEYVGGISKTVSYKGFYFDIGGHRFFSKSDEIENLWDEILGDDFLVRPRKSRIYYNKQLFNYPITIFDTLLKLGIFESIHCVLSYAKVVLFPKKNPENFEEWVTNKFGKRLFSIFFKTYTEKVWGMKCSEISADWAAQRIKGLSLLTTIKHALIPQKKSKEDVVKTLINSFRYPRKGPGMMWDRAAEKFTSKGGKLIKGSAVNGLEYKDGQWIIKYGDNKTIEADHVISSMPVRELINGISPKPDDSTTQAANSLKYRDFLIVALIIKGEDKFNDNWIYIHDPDVKVGRIQNFKSWSPEMVPDPEYNCYGMEYFCFEGDGLWEKSDDDLIKLASEELLSLDLVDASNIQDGYVIRQKKAYPVYDDEYKDHVQTIRDSIDSNYPNLHLVGRNGMHKYNNQDHAMMTAILTVKNIMSGENLYDVWNVNQDAQYHEEGEEKIEERLVPTKKK